MKKTVIVIMLLGIICFFVLDNVSQIKKDKLGIEYNEPLLNSVLSRIKRSPLVTNWTNKKIIQLVKHLTSSKIEKAPTTF